MFDKDGEIDISSRSKFDALCKKVAEEMVRAGHENWKDYLKAAEIPFVRKYESFRGLVQKLAMAHNKTRASTSKLLGKKRDRMEQVGAVPITSGPTKREAKASYK